MGWLGELEEMPFEDATDETERQKQFDAGVSCKHSGCLVDLAEDEEWLLRLDVGAEDKDEDFASLPTLC